MSQSFDDLKKQARHSYRYWHVVLEYHRRKINNRLEMSGRLPGQQHPFSDALNLLKDAGFPGLPPDLSAIASPVLLRADPCRQLFFHPVSATDGEALRLLLCVRMLEDDAQETSEILAVSAGNASYVEQASRHFNACLSEYPAEAVYEAAQLWAVLHGATVLPFQALDNPIPVPVINPAYAGTDFETIFEEDEIGDDDALFEVAQISWGNDW